MMRSLKAVGVAAQLAVDEGSQQRLLLRLRRSLIDVQRV